LDAAGLALFAVAGTQKALLYQLSGLVAALLGTLTAVGSGTIRDLLLAQVPKVLQTDVYATAALAGSAVFVVATKFRLRPMVPALLGGTVCFVLRCVSVWQHWNLPRGLGH
jgi:uncharacterized membrane protein YeiH